MGKSCIAFLIKKKKQHHHFLGLCPPPPEEPPALAPQPSLPGPWHAAAGQKEQSEKRVLRASRPSPRTAYSPGKTSELHTKSSYAKKSKVYPTRSYAWRSRIGTPSLMPHTPD